MLTFIYSVILGFMFFPAILSVLMASRSLFLLFWNMSWYLLMSWFGEQVFGPSGVWVGGTFAIIYTYKMLTKPVPSVQFQVKHFTSNRKNTWSPTGTTQKKASDITDENVIEAQYSHIESATAHISQNPSIDPKKH